LCASHSRAALLSARGQIISSHRCPCQDLQTIAALIGGADAPDARYLCIAVIPGYAALFRTIVRMAAMPCLM
jgi:hypothetical protein